MVFRRYFHKGWFSKWLKWLQNCLEDSPDATLPVGNIHPLKIPYNTSPLHLNKNWDLKTNWDVGWPYTHNMLNYSHKKFRLTMQNQILLSYSKFLKLLQPMLRPVRIIPYTAHNNRPIFLRSGWGLVTYYKLINSQIKIMLPDSVWLAHLIVLANLSNIALGHI